MFVWLTARSKSIKSFQFQISLFIIVWVAGEIVDLLGEEGTKLFADSQTRMYIHVIAMGMFSGIIWARFIVARSKGKKLADSIED